jgi:acyl-CoA dehydrogenase
VFAYFWARMAKIALTKQGQEPFYTAKLATARFYFARLVHETEALVPSVRSGAGNLLSLEADLF